MRLSIILSLFIIFVFHTITTDCYAKYERLNNQYNKKLPLTLFVETLVICEKQNISINMMISISWRESFFKNIIGRNGNDIGYYQINRSHVRPNEKFEDYFDLKKNVNEAVKTYRSALKKAKGDIKKALAYYNAGENYNLNKYPKSQWKDYVDFIIRNYTVSVQEDNRKIRIK